MPYRDWEGVLATIGNAAGTAGITNSRTVGVSQVGPWVQGMAAMHTHGVFGYSAINYNAGQNWTIGVWGNIVGVSVKIAELGGISGLSASIIPIVNEWTQAVLGATQTSFIGIPNPRTIVFTGSSAGIGITASFVVTANLGRNG